MGLRSLSEWEKWRNNEGPLVDEMEAMGGARVS
jgi:hypothetical protein